MNRDWKAVEAAREAAGLGLDAKLRRLLKRPRTILELANRLDCSPQIVERALRRLRAAGYQVADPADHAPTEIALFKDLPEGGRLVVDSRDFFDGTWHKFGVIGETHLCSRHAREDVLASLYDIFEREKITTVWHTGNMVDGECRFNRHDLIVPAGIEPQVEYMVKRYPRRDGITTRFITGDDHEGWWVAREGINIGQHLQNAAEQAGRKDLRWIGHVEADVEFKARRGKAWMRIMHPGGGSAYAISYTAQKIVESYQGGEKPHLLIIGHYHKFDWTYPREVHALQPGCCQDQTAFLRKQKIQAMVGGCIVRFHQADTGEINRLNVEWIPFFDRGFYARNDKWRRW